MASVTECPQCGGDNVELDSVQVCSNVCALHRPVSVWQHVTGHGTMLLLLQALSFCLDCGFVLTEADLDISVLFDAATGGPGGIILAKDDDGSRASELG
jgi:hypothetical protein